jgi:tRNA(fMet)-specific endonuclease VapC
MTSPQTLLDTDILSAIMRREPVAIAHARRYLAEHTQFTISIITRYEILRGLKAKNAAAQLARFELLCRSTEILPITDNIIVRAADIYADLYKRGEIIGDADILIAAKAIEHGLILATNNQDHHNRIAGIQIKNWLAT